jgi:hypothetical protein
LLQLLLGGVIRILRGLNTEPLLCSKPTQYRVDESHGSRRGDQPYHHRAWLAYAAPIRAD